MYVIFADPMVMFVDIKRYISQQILEYLQNRVCQAIKQCIKDALTPKLL